MRTKVKEVFEALKTTSFVKKNGAISQNGLLAISDLRFFDYTKACLITSSKNGVVTTKYRRAKQFLNELGIKFIESNDAPRGGIAGTYLLCSDEDASKWDAFTSYVYTFNYKTMKNFLDEEKINNALKAVK